MSGPIRIIFSITVLLLWAMFGIGLANGDWSATQWLMLVLGHLVCLVIFVSFIYVFNYGYGLTLAVIGLALPALMPSAAAAMVGLVAAAFGLRMLVFTHARYRAASYSENYRHQQQASAAMPLPPKLFLWIFVSWLMAFELMPLYFVARPGVLTGWVMAGAAIMLAGLVVEAVADAQKQAAKARDPSAFVDQGLFRLARHANYSGEIIFQAGLIVACMGSLSGWWEVLVAVLAPGYIIVLMLHEGRVADRRQMQRYGADAAYGRYRARTGCFMPGL